MEDMVFVDRFTSSMLHSFCLSRHGLPKLLFYQIQKSAVKFNFLMLARLSDFIHTKCLMNDWIHTKYLSSTSEYYNSSFCQGKVKVKGG